MAEHKLYLTVGREKRKPQNDGYIAIISQGQTQFGDDTTTVLSVTVVKNMKDARTWFRKMIVEQPWIPRS